MFLIPALLFGNPANGRPQLKHQSDEPKVSFFQYVLEKDRQGRVLWPLLRLNPEYRPEQVSQSQSEKWKVFFPSGFLPKDSVSILFRTKNSRYSLCRWKKA